MDDSSYIWQRIGATVIDYVVIFGLWTAFVFLAGRLVAPDSWQATVINFPIPFLVWFLYIVVPEGTLQATLGHRLVGLKVITMDGGKPGFGRVLVRRVFDLVDLSCTGGVLAFILVLATKEHQRVGDLVSQTRVVGRNFVPDIHFDFEAS